MVTGQVNIEKKIHELLDYAQTFKQAVAIVPGLKNIELSPTARNLSDDGTVIISGINYTIKQVGGDYYLRLLNGGWMYYVPPSVFTDSVRQSGA